MVPAGNVTAIGLVTRAQNYYLAGVICKDQNQSNAKRHDLMFPTLSLYGHCLELSLKGWLMYGGRSAAELKSIGHNLCKLLKYSLKTGLVLDTTEIVMAYADQVPDMHVTDDGDLVNERQRLQKLSQKTQRREVLIHFLMLNELHGVPYLARYPQTGLLSVPNLGLVDALVNSILDQSWRAVMQRVRNS